jgi:thymidylate kinase
MEREDEGFAQRVISGFESLAEQDPNRWKTVDASGSVEEIQLLVNKALEED